MMNTLFTKTMFFKILKFGVVGMSGMIIDFSFTYLFKEIVKIHKYIANAIGFCMAATWNYVFNRMWTFESQNPHYVNEFMRFFIVSLIGLGINTLILWLLVSKFKLNFYLSKLLAIGVVLIWNFSVNLMVTFVN
jgi:putative flippase GtrA